MSEDFAILGLTLSAALAAIDVELKERILPYWYPSNRCTTSLRATYLPAR
jgi:hypothetical protein